MNKQTDFDICQQLPQVALEFMNTVHCEELVLTQALLQAMEEGQALERIDAMLKEWVDHTVAHFAREERLMEEYRFPPYMIHKSEHQQALETLRSVQANWLQARDHGALENYIKVEWRQWLGNHISTMDTVTAGFLAQFDIHVDLDLD